MRRTKSIVVFVFVFVFVFDSTERSGVKDEEYRTKDGSLRNSIKELEYR